MKTALLLIISRQSSGNFLPTFRDNPSVASSGIKNPKEILLSQYRACIGRNVGTV